MMSLRQLERYKNPLYGTKEQFKRFIFDLADDNFTAGDQARDRVLTIDQHAERKAQMKETFLRSIGGLPAMDTPLNIQQAGEVCGNGFLIEKLIFESRPGAYVTSHLYVPDGLAGPSGAVLLLCGHSENGKSDDNYQVVCQHLVHAGLIVMAIDPIGQGERVSYFESGSSIEKVRWGVREHDQAGMMCLPLGQNIARYFIHDAMRAIDVLCTREEVDRSRIGVTGNSGGGTQTSMMMICDDRVAAAAPGTFYYE